MPVNEADKLDLVDPKALRAALVPLRFTDAQVRHEPERAEDTLRAVASRLTPGSPLAVSSRLEAARDPQRAPIQVRLIGATMGRGPC
jgi:hypothetical protein